MAFHRDRKPWSVHVMRVTRVEVRTGKAAWVSPIVVHLEDDQGVARHAYGATFQGTAKRELGEPLEAAEGKSFRVHFGVNRQITKLEAVVPAREGYPEQESLSEDIKDRARKAARDLYCNDSDDNIEVDDSGEVIRSGANNGFWVQAWTFVRACDCEDPEFSTSTVDTEPTCLPCGGIQGE